MVAFLFILYLLILAILTLQCIEFTNSIHVFSICDFSIFKSLQDFRYQESVTKIDIPFYLLLYCIKHLNIMMPWCIDILLHPKLNNNYKMFTNKRKGFVKKNSDVPF